MAQGSQREFAISCPPCVEAGEADWVYFIKNNGQLFWAPFNETPWKIGFKTKKMLQDLIIQKSVGIFQN